ncbi:PhoD-like phosphatase-domain-containing protein [Chytriomyces cf. hyalinus JEL632]|nr:PhoD-like phosphatase-domain-containing protein [Chytriomyces cf. hyalinus JEL632]
MHNSSFFHHNHPKRTLFLICVFLITSAQLLPVASRRRRRWFHNSSRVISAEALYSRDGFDMDQKYLETLDVHENLVYQHASEKEFYRQWTRSQVAFNVSGEVGSTDSEQSNLQFNHGVASGDPLHDSVILWTKVTAPQTTGSVYVKFAVSSNGKLPDSSLPGSPPTAIGEPLITGAVLTGPEVDFTIKLDIKGLNPKTTYYFQFSMASDASAHQAGSSYGLVYSPPGKTKTLPAPDDSTVSSIEFGVVSCSNLPNGFFNAYAGLAGKTDVDVVLHLGDYIYEYRNGEYGDGASIGRVPLPDRELLTLEDYRERHAQYKEDEDLQLLHRLKPWIVIWDDHEFVDDISGYAVSKLANESISRIPAAMRAYFEYLPIRVATTHLYKPKKNRLSFQKEADPDILSETIAHHNSGTFAIYRNFQFGTLVDLMMLDTRIHGRDKNDWATVGDELRTMLGEDQERWLIENLKDSSDRGTAWRLIGNQVVFAPMDHWGFMFNTDAWDGYPASRRRIIDAIETHGIKDVVVVTGDVHTSFAFDVPKSMDSYDKRTGSGSLLVEFVSPAISSPSPLESVYLGVLNRLAETLFPKMEPHMKWMDLSRRGYMVLKRIRIDDLLASLELKVAEFLFEQEEDVLPRQTVAPLLAKTNVLAGYMEHLPDKATTNTSGKHWKRLFFVLDKSTMFMFSDANTADFETDRFQLSSTTFILPKVRLDGQNFAFQISGTSFTGSRKSWILAAASNASKMVWINQLNTAIMTETVASQAASAAMMLNQIASTSNDLANRWPWKDAGVATSAPVFLNTASTGNISYVDPTSTNSSISTHGIEFSARPLAIANRYRGGGGGEYPLAQVDEAAFVGGKSQTVWQIRERILQDQQNPSQNGAMTAKMSSNDTRPHTDSRNNRTSITLLAQLSPATTDDIPTTLPRRPISHKRSEESLRLSIARQSKTKTASLTRSSIFSQDLEEWKFVAWSPSQNAGVGPERISLKQSNQVANDWLQLHLNRVKEGESKRVKNTRAAFGLRIDTMLR